eukprot:756164-Hanusia_phi.AAC.1
MTGITMIPGFCLPGWERRGQCCREGTWQGTRCPGGSPDSESGVGGGQPYGAGLYGTVAAGTGREVATLDRLT